MRYFIIITTFFILTGSLNTLLQAQDTTKTGKHRQDKPAPMPFVDEDGDGYNDNAPDHDGDGIPNGLDPDWEKQMNQNGKRSRWRFVDLDGDGINDFMQENREMHSEQMDPLMQQKRDGAPLDEQRKMQGDEKKRKQGGKH